MRHYATSINESKKPKFYFIFLRGSVQTRAVHLMQTSTKAVQQFAHGTVELDRSGYLRSLFVCL